jgi:hypothetical protein
MKTSTILLSAFCATTASAWTIDWFYTTGQRLSSNGRLSSGCVNLREDVRNLILDRYVVNFDTPIISDPNRVRLYRSTGCVGLTWDSNASGNNNLNPNRNVKSYIIDHD